MTEDQARERLRQTIRCVSALAEHDVVALESHIWNEIKAIARDSKRAQPIGLRWWWDQKRSQYVAQVGPEWRHVIEGALCFDAYDKTRVWQIGPMPEGLEPA